MVLDNDSRVWFVDSRGIFSVKSFYNAMVVSFASCTRFLCSCTSGKSQTHLESSFNLNDRTQQNLDNCPIEIAASKLFLGGWLYFVFATARRCQTLVNSLYSFYFSVLVFSQILFPVWILAAFRIQMTRKVKLIVLFLKLQTCSNLGDLMGEK